MTRQNPCRLYSHRLLLSALFIAPSSFHFSWFSFFLAFLAWFAFAPLMPVIKEQFNINKKDIWTGESETRPTDPTPCHAAPRRGFDPHPRPRSRHAMPRHPSQYLLGALHGYGTLPCWSHVRRGTVTHVVA